MFFLYDVMSCNNIFCNNFIAVLEVRTPFFVEVHVKTSQENIEWNEDRHVIMNMMMIVTTQSSSVFLHDDDGQSRTSSY